MEISRAVLLRMKNVSGKLCRENQNIILCSRTFPVARAVYDMRKHWVEPDRAQMTVRRMRCACWIKKTADT